MEEEESDPEVVINMEVETTSSEDDENAMLLTEELEKGFLDVLSRLKKKDPELYNENARFFASQSGNKDTSSSSLNCSLSQDKKRGQWTAEELKVENNKVEDNFWTKPDLNKDEQFLRDYILNKKFLDHDERFNLEKELENFEEEEKEVEEQLLFEDKYNHRFEQDDEDILKQYPHTMEKATGHKRKSRTASEDVSPKKIEEVTVEEPESKDELIKQDNYSGSGSEIEEETGSDEDCSVNSEDDEILELKALQKKEKVLEQFRENYGLHHLSEEKKGELLKHKKLRHRVIKRMCTINFKKKDKKDSTHQKQKSKSSLLENGNSSASKIKKKLKRKKWKKLLNH